MRIAVIGAGAMGSVYGGLLSERNEVWLIDSRSELVERIREEGLLIEEEGSSRLYRPRASLSSEPAKWLRARGNPRAVRKEGADHHRNDGGQRGSARARTCPPRRKRKDQCRHAL